MKSLLHLLQGDIKQIRQNYSLGEKDDAQVREMQNQLLNDRTLCTKLGWKKYRPGNKVLAAKAYLLALENYVSMRYGDGKKEDDSDSTDVFTI